MWPDAAQSYNGWYILLQCVSVISNHIIFYLILYRQHNMSYHWNSPQQEIYANQIFPNVLFPLWAPPANTPLWIPEIYTTQFYFYASSPWAPPANAATLPETRIMGYPPNIPGQANSTGQQYGQQPMYQVLNLLSPQLIRRKRPSGAMGILHLFPFNTMPILKLHPS